MNKNSLAGEVHPQKLQTNHLFKIMRITLLLAFISVFSLNAKDVHSQSARVTLSQTNSPLEIIINEIENQTDYLFIINSSIDTSKKVSITVKDATVSNVLNQLLRGTNVSYSTEGSYIILSQNQSQLNNNGLAQEVKDVIVTGNITDTSGEPLIGVNVILKGTNVGAISDIDGNYSLRVPEGKGEIQFSYIGYRNVVLPIEGKTVINVTMEEDSKVLGEVVVTAMGIERKAETLTYATQTVGGNELTRAKESNLINSLQGKSAGLSITPNSGGAGSASKVLLRGNASMLGNNSPLIVIDGVPMQNEVSRQMNMDGGANLIVDGSSEGSDPLSQINPDDIETITVLKGANAAALYGSKAANGVLMITTKKGKSGQLRVDVSSSTTFETPLVLPKIQDTYGTSIKGNVNNGYTFNGSNSWGSKLSDITDEQLQNAVAGRAFTRDPYNIRDFYQLGTNFNNSVSLSGGTEKVQTYFSYGNTTANGIVENNKFTRHNISLRENFNLFKDRLKIDISANYVNQKTKNRPSGGTIFSPIYNLYTAPRNVDMNYYRNNYADYNGTWMSNGYSIFERQKDANGQDIYVRKDGHQTELTSPLYGKQMWFDDAINLNNPWWLMNRLTSEEILNRTYGSVGANLKIIEGLNLQARLKYDYYESNNETRQYATTWGNAEMIDRGRLISDHTKGYDFYGDFMLAYNKTIKDFTLSANFGGSMFNSFSDQWKITPTASSGAPWTEDKSCNQFILENIYIKSSENYGGQTVKNWERSIFATAQLSYKDMVTIEGSYREDWYRAFTQFRDMKPHFPYFSVGTNARLNNIFELPDLISDFKVRLSYSEVGNSIPNLLLLSATITNSATGAVSFNSTVDFKNPKPETSGSFEGGIDLSLFGRAVNIEATYYNATMKNQFMRYKGNGGKMIFINGGKVRNQGLELTTSYILAPNNDFSWKTAVNYAFNTNKIITVARDSKGKPYDYTVDMGYLSGLKVKFLEGGSYGDLYAVDFKKKDGKIVVNPNNGAPFKQNGVSNEYLGNMNAKHTLGWSNTFTYKDFQFYFLIDGKIGGKVVSFTEAYLDYFGNSEASANARLKAEAEGTMWTSPTGEQELGMYLENGELVSIQQYYSTIGGQAPIGKYYVHNGTNFRMREISLGYTFRNLFGAGKNLTVAANARNLFFLYKDAPIDPETSMSTQNALSNVDIFSMPTTRSFGLTLKASF